MTLFKEKNMKSLSDLMRKAFIHLSTPSEHDNYD